MFRKRVATAAVVAFVAGLTGIEGCSSTRSGSPNGNRPEPTSGAKQADGQTMYEIFAGKFPGVQVFAAPDGGISLRIRGSGTLLGSTEPQYVIDGMPVAGGTGGLIFINPADIETIEVLKDAASLAFYGMQGANGVVLITTKRGP